MVFQDTPCAARIDEMNWFLLTLPVTILYESTGMPKRRFEESDIPGTAIAVAVSAAVVFVEAVATVVVVVVSAVAVVASGEAVAVSSAMVLAIAVTTGLSATMVSAIVVVPAESAIGVTAFFPAVEGLVHETAIVNEAARRAGP